MSDLLSPLIGGGFTIIGVILGYCLNYYNNKQIFEPFLDLYIEYQFRSNQRYGETSEKVLVEIRISSEEKIRNIVPVSIFRAKISDLDIGDDSIWVEIPKAKQKYKFCFAATYRYKGYNYKKMWLCEWVPASYGDDSLQIRISNPLGYWGVLKGFLGMKV